MALIMKMLTLTSTQKMQPQNKTKQNMPYFWLSNWQKIKKKTKTVSMWRNRYFYVFIVSIHIGKTPLEGNMAVHIGSLKIVYTLVTASSFKEI